MPAWKKAGKLTIQCAPCLLSRVKLDIPTIVVDLRPIAGSRKRACAWRRLNPYYRSQPCLRPFPEGQEGAYGTVLQRYGIGDTGLRSYQHLGRIHEYSGSPGRVAGVAENRRQGRNRSNGDEGLFMSRGRGREKSPWKNSKGSSKRSRQTSLSSMFATAEEAESGMLVGAKNIATSGCCYQAFSKFRRKRKVIVHCTTGIRAELAYLALKDAGYKARFLNAIIKVDPKRKVRDF